VTDADLILGKLDPDNFAAGTIQLHVDRSAAALDAVLGEKLSMPTIEAAWGLAEVVDENMANAARVHAVENGEDLSEYTMIAFGGAAPLHAARLCEKLGVSRCLVPPGAGVGSAIGFLRAPFSFEANRTVFMKISAFDSNVVRQIFAEMEDEATRFVRSCDATAEIKADFKVYMRYAGQGWEIPVPLTAEEARAADPATFLARFEADYANLFGRTVQGLQAEITVWSVNAYTPTTPVLPAAPVTVGAEPERAGERTLFDAAQGKRATARVYERTQFAAGSHISGPAVVTEEETTIIVPASRVATALSDGCIDITVKGA
jgi:N-methylhydantoinase A